MAVQFFTSIGLVLVMNYSSPYPDGAPLSVAIDYAQYWPFLARLHVKYIFRDI